MKQKQDDGERRLEQLQLMLKDEHSDKMNTMKEFLQDEHAGALQAHSAAHAARARSRKYGETKWIQCVISTRI